MNQKAMYFRLRLNSRVLFAAVLLLSRCLLAGTGLAGVSQPLATDVDPNPPASVVKLIFIHHFTGHLTY